MMKNCHLLPFLLKKENINWNAKDAILHFREQCEEGARRFVKIPSGIEIKPVDIYGLPA
jgi:hypothetical protein